MLDLKYLRARLKQIDTLLECANSVGWWEADPKGKQ